jgi:hypothetical protein
MTVSICMVRGALNMYIEAKFEMEFMPFVMAKLSKVESRRTLYQG